MAEISYSIRKYATSDKDNILTVLYETSSMPIETKEQRAFLRLMFNDYYTEEESENCFVVADEADEAVGYIICAENFAVYEKVFKEKYMPEMAKLGKKYVAMAKGELFLHRLYAKKYPAHLHIDILPVCQGAGAGTKLVKALCEHLSSKNVEGLMLSCGAANKKAIKFYYKNGFKKLVNFFGSFLMGKEI